ncbi:unnamed protein product [Phaedon cochleariae]|uniref:Lipase domain-containing protein n=1 Tax=Phaedon cochleariae TaxID=80249 RepID=A0A9P0DLA8_PHACE|nr:unnamed protein product [Phaedon cochleariae]
MKALILYFIGFYSAYSSPVATVDDQSSFVTHLISEIDSGQYEIEDLMREAVFKPPQESDIQFYFHVRNGPADGIKVYWNDSEGIRSAGFAKEKHTLFIIHGWRNQYDAKVIEVVSKAALDVQDINVFAVDWSKISFKTYLEASSAVPEVGSLLGKLMDSLVENNGLDLANTTVAGHSLGAHVAGIACAHVEGECDVIVGMDPAGPLFSYDKTEGRLDTTDAKFVHVIHTNAGLLGFNKAIGHADYFPNGGGSQPGCILDITGSCSHSRSYLYYAESLTSGHFTAMKCDNYTEYKNGNCDGQIKSFMGQYQVDKSARGSYFLKTHSSAPFAMGDNS